MKKLVNRTRQLMPVRPFLNHSDGREDRVFITYAMRRSGQHAIINWLSHQLGDVAHVNNCVFRPGRFRYELVPKAGRVSTIRNGELVDSGVRSYRQAKSEAKDLVPFRFSIYSLEDEPYQPKLIRKLAVDARIVTMFILRDPLNWLASTMAAYGEDERFLRQQISRYNEYAEVVGTTAPQKAVMILYHRWCVDSEYRQSICRQLEIPFDSDGDAKARVAVPNFGGGSSFDQLSKAGQATAMKTLDRWNSFANNPLFRQLVESSFDQILLEKLDLSLGRESAN